MTYDPPDSIAAVMTPAEVRQACRVGAFNRPTRGAAVGWVHCNLVVLDQRHAYDFLLYCQRNPKACPVMEITDTGNPEPRRTASGADLRSDLARYHVFRDGVQADDSTNINDLWTDTSIGFLIGSGITFDGALQRAGVPTDKDRWVVNTDIDTEPAGVFSGKLVATMRWLTPEQAIIATQVSARFPNNHGAPIHIGDPAQIGADLANPLFGPPVGKVRDGQVAVFWACGVTPQSAALNAGIDLMITHAPAHGLPIDIKSDDVALP